MKLKKSLFLILIIFTSILLSGCSVLKDKIESNEIQQSWMEIHKIFINNNYNLEVTRPQVINKYNNFFNTITSFFNSPQFYVITSIYADDSTIDLKTTKAELSANIIVLKYYIYEDKQIDEAEISNLLNNISNGLLSLQVMENITTKKITTKYTLFFILILTFFTITAGLLFLFVTKYEKKLHEAKEIGIYSTYTIEGIEIERKRIAMEIHDSVIQDLKFARINTELITTTDEDNKLKKKEILETITKSINGLRRICSNLNPFGYIMQKNQSEWNIFVSALNLLVENFNQSNKISCIVKIDENLISGKITTNVILNIFRIIQEALTNISKHSKALNASIIIRNDNSDKPSSIIIFIIDDGIGFDLNLYSLYHFGISNMKERAEQIHGKIEIISEENDGTKIRLEIPINE